MDKLDDLTVFILPSGSALADVEVTKKSFQDLVPDENFHTVPAISTELFSCGPGFFIVIYDNELVDNRLLVALRCYLDNMSEDGIELFAYNQADFTVSKSPRVFPCGTELEGSLLPVGRSLRFILALDGWIYQECSPSISKELISPD